MGKIFLPQGVLKLLPVYIFEWSYEFGWEFTDANIYVRVYWKVEASTVLAYLHDPIGPKLPETIAKSRMFGNISGG